MKKYNIVKLEGDTMEFPEEAFDALELRKYGYVLIETDPDEKESLVTPLAVRGSELVEINMVLKNIPGAMAKVDLLLGENLINILYNEGEMIDEEKSAAIRLADISKSKLNMTQIDKHLKDLDVVEEFEILEENFD
ncbi:MAG: hypothetical protein U9N35_04260 [Euryarchaeota archaeon]|nr:hypothetical protein [Euryarchaeota archaeon]